MDVFWEQALQSVPDDHFVPAAESHTVLNVWYESQNGTLQFERTSVDKQHLREWARTSVSAPDNGTGPQLVFQGLVISTHEFNDFPVDISRDDLSHVARGIGISSAHVPLLFAPCTGYATLDRHVCWYYGLPGLRALASTRTAQGLTRAIVTVSVSSQQAFEEDLHHLSGFAKHLLMLAFAVRASALRECGRLMKVYFNSLLEAERITGFHTDYDEDNEDTEIGSLSKDSRSSSSIDLGKLTKKIGSAASNLGNFKIILAQLGSMDEILSTNDRLKWCKHFVAQPLLDYKRQSEEIIEMDTTFEFMRRGLLEAITEYQDRAKSLQSVVRVFFSGILFGKISSSSCQAHRVHIDIQSHRQRRRQCQQRYRPRFPRHRCRHQKRGTCMRTIAIMTMVFLPATFYAALFAVPTLQWEQSPVIQSKFWMYWAFTVPSTVLVLFVWYVVVTRQVEKERRGKEEDNHKELRSMSRHRTAGFIFRPVMKTAHLFQDTGIGAPDRKVINLTKAVPRIDNAGVDFRKRPVSNGQQDRSRSQKANMNLHSTIAAGDENASLVYHMA